MRESDSSVRTILVSIQEDDWQLLILRFFARICSTRRKIGDYGRAKASRAPQLDHHPGNPASRQRPNFVFASGRMGYHLAVPVIAKNEAELPRPVAVLTR